MKSIGEPIIFQPREEVLENIKINRESPLFLNSNETPLKIPAYYCASYTFEKIILRRKSPPGFGTPFGFWRRKAKGVPFRGGLFLHTAICVATVLIQKIAFCRAILCVLGLTNY